MPGRLRRITSRWPNGYFLFSKLKEHLSGTRYSSESDVKTVVENCLNGQDVSTGLIFAKASHIVWPPSRWQKLDSEMTQTDRQPFPCPRRSWEAE
ncbi:hypothetical protein AVEN_125307-1 [Araneus ventricosus]|uniref:Uncharacterized protein n=1 Tax=Araneus ventricosus TaxID=182803 RepID=A0A4Y2Q756_ARAVE|nr:hypothetical protein AVEN_125307-1 [Araneus ventricosus]